MSESHSSTFLLILIACSSLSVGCDDKTVRPAVQPREAVATPEAEPSRPSLPQRTNSLAEDGVAIRLDITYRLEPEFTIAFPGSAEEAAAGVRKAAFTQDDPGAAVLLRVDDDVRLLEGHFEGTNSFQNQARVASVLAGSRSWKPKGREVPADPRFDPIKKAAIEKAKSWQHALLQLGNKAARETALEEMAAALATNDPVAQVAAMDGLTSAHEVDFDRGRFRPLVLALLTDPVPQVRAGAVAALLAVEPQPEDLGRVLPMVDDPTADVRRMLPFAIQRLAKGDLTGVAAEPIMRLIDRAPAEEMRNFLSSLWGSKYSPELAEKLVALPTTKRGVSEYDVMYYSLSTQQNKGEKTVDVLISCLSDADQGNVGGRALWGLGYGVNPDQQPRVADAVLEFFTARTGRRDECLRILAQYGGATHAAALVAFGQREGVSAELRKQIEGATTAIQQRAQAQ
jgi:hypothetical protein